MSESIDQSDLPRVGAAPIRSARDAARFALAGAATVTVVSTATDKRYTFKIAAPKNGEGSARFVSLLNGPDNQSDFLYLGFIPNADAPCFRLTKKSAMRFDAAPVRAAMFLCDRVLAHPEAPIPAGLEIWHEGRCGKCNRPLTVPESIERGIGPECWARLGGS